MKVGDKETRGMKGSIGIRLGFRQKKMPTKVGMLRIKCAMQ